MQCYLGSIRPGPTRQINRATQTQRAKSHFGSLLTADRDKNIIRFESG